MAYGVSYTYLYRPATSHVDKIFKGAEPADLPVDQPTRFEFIISLNATNKSV